MNLLSRYKRAGSGLPLQNFDHGCVSGRHPRSWKGTIMQSGKVKWFNAQKGYGFIEPEAGGQDVFVHISAVERAGLQSLAEGQKISYELLVDKRSGKFSADQLQIAD